MKTIKNPTMATLLKRKDKAVKEGREISKQLAALDKKLEELRVKEHEITKAVACDDLIEEAEILAKKIDEQMVVLEDIYNKVREEKVAAIPPAIKDKHETLLQEQKRLEKKRAKLGEEIQKVKDKFVPWLHKRVAKDLKSEFDDIETAKLNKDGDIEVHFFNHIDSFKTTFRSRRKAEKKTKKQG